MNTSNLRKYIVDNGGLLHFTKQILSNYDNLTAKEICNYFLNHYLVHNEISFNTIEDITRKEIVSQIMKDFNKKFILRLNKINIDRKKEDNFWIYSFNTEYNQGNIKKTLFFNENISNEEMFKSEIYDINNVMPRLKKLKSNNVPINRKSISRGDYIYKWQDIYISIDSKNYDNIQGRMKFPKKLNIKNYIKTIDSSILREFGFLSSNEIMIDYLPVTDEESIINLILSKSKVNKTVNNINKEALIELINFGEYGIISQSYKEKDKYLISKSNDQLELKKLNFNSLLDIEQINLIYEPISDNGYIYIYFEDNKTKEIIYILSNRSDMKTANCSFFSKKYIKTISSIEINKDKYFKYEDLYKNNGKAQEYYIWEENIIPQLFKKIV